MATLEATEISVVAAVVAGVEILAEVVDLVLEDKEVTGVTHLATILADSYQKHLEDHLSLKTI